MRQNRWWIIVVLLVVVVALWIRARPRASQTDYARAHMEEALRLLKEGDVVRAKSRLELAMAMNPGEPEPYFLLGDLQGRSGNLDEAAKTFRKLARANPAARHVHCRLAGIYILQGAPTLAADEGRIAARHEPKCPAAHASYGVALFDLEDRERGIEELRKAHRVDPKDNYAAISLAQRLIIEKKYAEAQELIDRIQQREPENPSALYLEGWLCVESGQNKKMEKATLSLTEAVKSDPTNVHGMAILAQIRVKQRRYEEAKAILEQAWRTSPITEVARGLSQVYDALGQPGPARSAKRVYEKMKTMRDRRKELRRKLLEDGNNVNLIVTLAKLERDREKFAEALELVRRALKIDPDHAEALRLLRRIAQ